MYLYKRYIIRIMCTSLYVESMSVKACTYIGLVGFCYVPQILIIGFSNELVTYQFLSHFNRLKTVFIVIISWFPHNMVTNQLTM